MFDLFDPVAGGLFWIDRDLKKATEEAMDDEQTFDPVLIENTRWRAQLTKPLLDVRNLAVSFETERGRATVLEG